MVLFNVVITGPSGQAHAPGSCWLTVHHLGHECSGVFTRGGDSAGLLGSWVAAEAGDAEGSYSYSLLFITPQIELRPGLPGYRDHSSRASGAPLSHQRCFPLAYWIHSPSPARRASLMNKKVFCSVAGLGRYSKPNPVLSCWTC